VAGVSAVLATIGSAITIAFGAWHLFVPRIWSWYSYIPADARELVVAVRAINIFFSVSLIMFGTLECIFVHRKPFDAFSATCMTVTLAVLWGLRTVIQIVWPQGSISPALQYGLLAVFSLTFVLFVIAAARL
jgi:hypothetical protein